MNPDQSSFNVRLYDFYNSYDFTLSYGRGLHFDRNSELFQVRQLDLDPKVYPSETNYLMFVDTHNNILWSRSYGYTNDDLCITYKFSHDGTYFYIWDSTRYKCMEIADDYYLAGKFLY